MQLSVNHEVYGTITYNENAWTGKREIAFGQTILSKSGKNTFVYSNGETELPVSVKGSFLFGVKLFVGAEEIQLSAAAKWYEIALSVLIFAFVLVWGNSVALCSIVPIVGGAIGGFISGVGMVLCLYFMRKTAKIEMKILIWVLCFFATIAACFCLAVALLSLIA